MSQLPPVTDRLGGGGAREMKSSLKMSGRYFKRSWKLKSSKRWGISVLEIYVHHITV